MNCLLKNYRKMTTENIGKLIIKAYPKEVVSILKFIGEQSEKLNYRTFIVGGTVRDIILARRGRSPKESKDIDIAVECSKWELIQKLTRKVGQSATLYKFHNEFNTATLFFDRVGQPMSVDNIRIDFTPTRFEIYPKPGSLPQVRCGADICRDLYRRDFTMNSIAACLNPTEFGVVYDPYGGLLDIKRKLIKVIHKESFRDDPTRIIRAIRFVSRFNFKLEKTTKDLLLWGLKNDYLKNVSRERLRNEFICVLKENPPCRTVSTLKLFQKYGIYISNMLKFKGKIFKLLNHPLTAKYPVQIKIAILLSKLNLRQIKTFLEDMKFERRLKNEIIHLFRFMSGEINAVPLPVWSDDFFSIINFNYPRQTLITGNDLIKFGFKPGAIFKKILLDVNRNKNIKSYFQAKRYILRKYQQ